MHSLKLTSAIAVSMYVCHCVCPTDRALVADEVGKQFCKEEDAMKIVKHNGYYPFPYMPIKAIARMLRRGAGWCSTHVMDHKSGWAEYILKASKQGSVDFSPQVLL